MEPEAYGFGLYLILITAILFRGIGNVVAFLENSVGEDNLFRGSMFLCAKHSGVTNTFWVWDAFTLHWAGSINDPYDLLDLYHHQI